MTPVQGPSLTLLACDRQHDPGRHSRSDVPPTNTHCHVRFLTYSVLYYLIMPPSASAPAPGPRQPASQPQGFW